MYGVSGRDTMRCEVVGAEETVGGGGGEKTKKLEHNRHAGMAAFPVALILDVGKCEIYVILYEEKLYQLYNETL